MARKPALRLGTAEAAAALATIAAPAITLESIGHGIADAISKSPLQAIAGLCTTYAKPITKAEYDEKVWPVVATDLTNRGVSDMSIGSYKSLYRWAVVGISHGHAPQDGEGAEMYRNRVKEALIKASLMPEVKGNRAGTGAGTGKAANGGRGDGGGAKAVQEANAKASAGNTGKEHANAADQFDHACRVLALRAGGGAATVEVLKRCFADKERATKVVASLAKWLAQQDGPTIG